MKNVKLDLSYSNIKQEDIMKYSNQVENIHNELHEKSKDENEFLGWLDLPTDYDKKEVEEYGEKKEKFLSVKPGLTGYWQVNGRSNTTYEERMKMELYYVDNCSMWLDIRIFFKTFITVFKKEGAM